MNWLIKMMSKANKKRAGFTLIELMVVVIVVGILAAAAIPIYRFAMSRAYSSEGKATMGTMMTSMKVFAAETADGLYPAFVFGGSDDAEANDILVTLGVETTTNTWWHAGYLDDTHTTNCVFGTTIKGSWPTGVMAVQPGASNVGPFVYAWGNEDDVAGTEPPIYNIKMVYDMGADEWFTRF